MKPVSQVPNTIEGFQDSPTLSWKPASIFSRGTASWPLVSSTHACKNFVLILAIQRQYMTSNIPLGLPKEIWHVQLLLCHRQQIQSPQVGEPEQVAYSAKHARIMDAIDRSICLWFSPSAAFAKYWQFLSRQHLGIEKDAELKAWLKSQFRWIGSEYRNQHSQPWKILAVFH